MSGAKPDARVSADLGRAGRDPPTIGFLADRGEPAIFVALEVRVTGHFLRRLEERGGDPDCLVLEGDRLAACGGLRAIHRHDYSFVVPCFGQIRLRVDRHRRGFVAVTFLPLGAS